MCVCVYADFEAISKLPKHVDLCNIYQVCCCTNSCRCVCQRLLSPFVCVCLVAVVWHGEVETVWKLQHNNEEFTFVLASFWKKKISTYSCLDSEAWGWQLVFSPHPLLDRRFLQWGLSPPPPTHARMQTLLLHSLEHTTWKYYMGYGGGNWSDSTHDTLLLWG